MLVATKCIPCYLDQAIRALEQAQVDPDQQLQILHELLETIRGFDVNKSPAENSSLVMHRLVELLDGQDPFAEAKQKSNEKAQALRPQLAEDIHKAKDPLFQALQFAVAGNVVDLALFDDYDLSEAIQEVTNKGFALNHYVQFKDALQRAKTVLIIGDNSGEIVFDALLVQHLKDLGKEVIYGVKGGFVINDATMEDAQVAGITELAQVISNGNNFLGTIEEYCSEEFLTAYQQADLVVSKGQANYESLEGTALAGSKTFFVLKAKCPLVGDNLGVAFGDMVLVQNQVQDQVQNQERA